MPRKTSQGNRSQIQNRGRKSASVQSEKSAGLDLRKINNQTYRNLIKAVNNNPRLLYLASGVGVFLLGRFVFRYYRNHPEISDYIWDNIDNVESRLRQFRGGRERDEEFTH